MSDSSSDAAVVRPEKQFFVSMLTRDIDLVDAILDLVDNCLDGVLRLANDQDNEAEYSGHSISITLNENEFVIKDDCGGIPRSVAKHYAFKMGRGKDDLKYLNDRTIGMYGVGMKRAMFKMGRSASVKTMHKNDCFEVSITPEWLDDPEWTNLPISSLEASMEAPGTEISVKDLFDGVKVLFEDRKSFENDLILNISRHFTRFLKEGLSIFVNGQEVKREKVEILVDTDSAGPAPYFFQKKIDGVLVTMAIGLNSSKEIDSDGAVGDSFADNRSSALSGWTVFCNNRAILFGDKSRLTGWGDEIPLYHDQFSIITGVVQFESDDASKLPTTTTKRSLDLSSNVWLETYTEMKKGLRVWTSYTNRWKNHPRDDQTSYWENARPMSLTQVMDVMLSARGIKKKGGCVEYNPQKSGHLPKPESSKPSNRRIWFSRPIEEIREVSDFLFDTPDERPGLVGDECFSRVLDDIRRTEEND